MHSSWADYKALFIGISVGFCRQLYASRSGIYYCELYFHKRRLYLERRSQTFGGISLFTLRKGILVKTHVLTVPPAQLRHL